jgi:RNA-directed DNA polymerase
LLISVAGLHVSAGMMASSRPGKAGRVFASTNNQMELRAVIEAVRFVERGKSIIIRTDSQYVSDAINRQTVIKSNSDLWREFREISSSRRIKVIWIKGHAGDPHNEAADRLAANQANLALVELGRAAA